MLKRDWHSICNSYHFDPRVRWSYATDRAYAVDVACVLDVDNTLTSRPTLTDNWLGELYTRGGLDRLKPEVDAALRFLATNPYRVRDAFDRIFLGIFRGVLSEDVNRDACAEAAYKTPPLANTADLMFDLRDRGVATAVMTYGILGALVPWYASKVGVPVHTLAGTRLIFKGGLLAGYDMGGDYGKVSRAESLIRSMGMRPDQVVAVSDDPVIDESMAAMIGEGLMVWTDSNGKRRELASAGGYKYPGRNVAVLRGVDDDRRMITDYVDRKMRAEFVAGAVRPSRILALRDEFAKAEAALDCCIDGDGACAEMLEQSVAALGRVVSLGRPFVASITNKAEEDLAALRSRLYSGTDTRELLNVADSVRSTLRRENPELSMPHEYVDEIRGFIRDSAVRSSFSS